MKQATIQDLKLELWLRQRNSGFIIWTTIPIKDMDNNHLINTINMLLRQREEAEYFNNIMVFYRENEIIIYFLFNSFEIHIKSYLEF